MLKPASPEDQALCNELLHLPYIYEFRYTSAADHHLRECLFRSLAQNRDDYLRLLFPNGPPTDQSRPWSLKEAQGAQEGAEYTAAAKGTACGHIFKSGESTYQCKTCALDDSCVLCVRCFESSDHEGHNVFISVSPGNSGCCDCGDDEAWKREVRCSIHTASTPDDEPSQASKDKAKAPVIGSQLPADLVESIRMTIARALDYLCDVLSCSPEQLRLPKSEAVIRQDEEMSHLGLPYGKEPPWPDVPEFALLLWNDEKHTIDDVQNHVARACSESKRFGRAKAQEVDTVGRAVVWYSKDLQELLRMSEIIEYIKITTTIRSSRDTFREEMCKTIIDWIQDMSGCSVGSDFHILRNTVCEELLKPWRTGSPATNADVGQDGLDDHEEEENAKLRQEFRAWLQPLVAQTGQPVRVLDGAQEPADEESDDLAAEDNDDALDYDTIDMGVPIGERMDIDDGEDLGDMDVDFIGGNEDETGAFEATLTGYPPPPPPHQTGGPRRQRIFTPAESEDGENPEPAPPPNAPYGVLPKTPKAKARRKSPKPSKHWLEKPESFWGPRPTEPSEDLWQRLRLDFLILYDLRLWKTLRISLRHLYITTVVTIPNFKRILGLRFAGLYTTLSQLYLIADREPDHSIINLSVQMLTTPSITEEVVERGNFLTNLMAILYTFLTTRQVGYPEDVNLQATLAFDAGAVTNRRLFRFFVDLRWLCQSEYVHYKIRIEPRYLLQFLDLVKLHQGVCPNVRATGEHVEYESDAWISASMIVKDINRLCRQVAASFEPRFSSDDQDLHLPRAIRMAAQATMINSFGYERKRFVAAEVKDDMAWHTIGFRDGLRRYSVPKFVVQTEPMSFHHPLHYLLSWLLEHGRTMSRDTLRALLTFSPDDLKDPWNPPTRSAAVLPPSSLTPDELLCSIFDHPLRTCVWLAQMKAGMWVRNGITLRHQAYTYRSVNHRDVGYQRDLLLLQAGLVLCGNDNEAPGERFLAQIIDRFEMVRWVQGDYTVLSGYEPAQQIDVVEDFFHLLIILLSDRGILIPANFYEQSQADQILQHDIAHALIFKPLSFSDLKARLTEKIEDSDSFPAILENMAVYRAPEGLSDTGTFELKPEFIELVDPYYAHYSRNHREEAETLCKKYMARKTGKKVEEIVLERRLQPIPGGSLFASLSAFTRTELFIQVLCAALTFAAEINIVAAKLQTTRVETFLMMVLHLVLLATLEDGIKDDSSSFTDLAAQHICALGGRTGETVVSLLATLAGMDEYASCHPTIKHVLRSMQQRQPAKLSNALGHLGAMLDRADTGSPASLSAEDKEKKKAEALARQARAMAKMKEQQVAFMQKQGLASFGGTELDFDHDDEDNDFDDMSITDEPQTITEPQRKTWDFPSGTCILCQEDTDDQRLYGTFAYLGESSILRTTPIDDMDLVKEVMLTPASLDRPCDGLRPFGIAGDNKQVLTKVTADGKSVTSERQGLSKGFPHQPQGNRDPVSTSCGHIMHFNCFEQYVTATSRRHQQQIARNHPERIELKEFVCPLCKALGNTFIPIIWKAKECATDNELHAAQNLNDLFDLNHFTTSENLGLSSSQKDSSDVGSRQMLTVNARSLAPLSDRASQYVSSMFAPSLVSGLRDLRLDSPAVASSSTQAPRHPLRRGYSLSSLFRMTRHGESGSSLDYSSSPLSRDEHQNRMAELVKAYRRIDETILLNHICPQLVRKEGVAKSFLPLSRALGLSISAFEIAHRGMPGDPMAPSILADLSEHNTTHFRILAETVESVLAVGVLGHTSNPTPLAPDMLRLCETMMVKIFGAEGDIIVRNARADGTKFLFQDDIFLCFCDWLSAMAPGVAAAASILQVFYWAEIVKTVFVFKHVVKMQEFTHLAAISNSVPVSEAFKLAVSGLVMEGLLDVEAQSLLSDRQLQSLRHIVDKYALAFLRKAIVLMHVRYGLDFKCPHNINLDAPELQRLTALLHIPSIDELCIIYTSHGVGNDNLRNATKAWIYQANVITEDNDGIPISMPHPAIFELVGLPKHYDTLTEEALKRRCPSTGRDLTDPAICLFCGAIFCSQGVCCTKDRNKGGCYQHMLSCGSKVGIFIIIRKCMVLFLHDSESYNSIADGDEPRTKKRPNGSFMHAPYLDRHGEPDPTLRRHHQLFLHQRRYDKLMREAWLGHTIPTVISRKLEADINPGGWETL